MNFADAMFTASRLLILGEREYWTPCVAKTEKHAGRGGLFPRVFRLLFVHCCPANSFDIAPPSSSRTDAGWFSPLNFKFSYQDGAAV
jgi:hypothetical protein